MDSILLFLHSLSTKIGTLLIRVLKRNFPEQKSLEKFATPAGELIFFTLFVALTMIASKVVIYILLIAWLFLCIRIILEK